MKIAKTMEYYC